MANADFSDVRVNTGFTVVSEQPDNSLQLEKISCSMANLSEHELLGLRGKSITVLRRFSIGVPDERVVARVLAVHLPALGSGVETSLLLADVDHGLDTPDYVDVADLTLLGRP